jgi:hypothetical protein
MGYDLLMVMVIWGEVDGDDAGDDDEIEVAKHSPTPCSKDRRGISI